MRAFISAFLLIIFALPAAAEEAKKAKPEIPEPRSFVTQHQGRFGGETVRYTATAAEIYLRDENDEPTASIFSIAYTRNGVERLEDRPVIFVFNGGPGSASLWLHMGFYGPRRVDVPSEAEDDGAPPYDLAANPQSPLELADLVFIDPVGTGFSRAIGEKKNKEFWGIRQDARSVAEFIRLWVAQNKRWNSPKYLSGESYGTTRAAAVAEELQGGWTSIDLNGLILISSILDFTGARFQPGNEIPYISFLPSYAATHWYHNLRGSSDVALADFVEEARRFALGDYAAALLQGARLADNERGRVRAELARLTGLSEGYLDQTDLRINNMRFMKELLREDGIVVGRLDSRYTGRDYDGAGERFDGDPSAYGIDAAYTAAVTHYLTSELGVEITRKYQVLSRAPGRNWDWTLNKNQNWPAFVNVAPFVGRAMRENNGFRVLVANGYYDLATPFFATENTFATNGIDPDRVTLTYYEAGHMMYVHHPSLEKLGDDVRAFLTAQ